MDCQLFESRVSEYLERELAPEVERECAEHLMLCVECRNLLRDVEYAIRTLRKAPIPDLSCELASRVLAIGETDDALTCSEFEDRITDFLDGFVEAPAYHAFQNHASSCSPCSDTLTETVLAVAACHSVHFAESCEVPEHVIQRILEKTSVARERRRALWSFWDRWIEAAREFFRPVLTPQWAAGFAIVGASMMVLVFSVSDDGSWAGVARRTNDYATKAFAHGETWVTQKQTVLDDLKSLSAKIAALWNKQANPPQQPATSSNSQSQQGGAAAQGSENSSGQDASPGNKDKPRSVPDQGGKRAEERK